MRECVWECVGVCLWVCVRVCVCTCVCVDEGGSVLVSAGVCGCLCVGVRRVGLSKVAWPLLGSLGTLLGLSEALLGLSWRAKPFYCKPSCFLLALVSVCA